MVNAGGGQWTECDYVAPDADIYKDKGIEYLSSDSLTYLSVDYNPTVSTYYGNNQLDIVFTGRNYNQSNVSKLRFLTNGNVGNLDICPIQGSGLDVLSHLGTDAYPWGSVHTKYLHLPQTNKAMPPYQLATISYNGTDLISSVSWSSLEVSQVTKSDKSVVNIGYLKSFTDFSIDEGNID